MEVEILTMVFMVKKVGVCLLLGFLLLSLVQGCGGNTGGSDSWGNVQNPQEGDNVALGIAQGGARLMDINFVARTVEPATEDVPAVVMWFIDAQTVYEENGEADIKIGHCQDELTPEDVSSFLESYWDDYFGGEEDEGWNGVAFIEYLNQHELNATDFINLFFDYHGSFLDFMALLTAFDNLDKTDEDEFADFLVYLESQNKTMNEFLEILTANGMTTREFLDHMKYYGLDFLGLGNIDEEEDLQALAGAAIDAGGDDSGKTDIDPSKFTKALKDINDIVLGWANFGLSVSKFAWSVIKDGKPTIKADGAFTSVLKKQDNDPLNYGYAKTMTTKEITVAPLGEKHVLSYLLGVQWKGKIAYDARHSTIGGHYIPSLLFDVDWARVFWGYQVDMSATIGLPYNPGSPQTPDPVFSVHNHLRVGSFLYVRILSTEWEARGSTGMKLVKINN